MIPDWMQRFHLTPASPPNEGILFADLSAQGRGGHMGHALVEYAPGCLLGFYPNCNDDNHGHSGNGWMEYRRSINGGVSWSDPIVLPYSKELYDAKAGRTAMCEQAVLAADGTIVLFILHCDMETNGSIWEPYFEAAVITSKDGGETWSDPYPFSKDRGRIYDVVYRNGKIFVLFFANPELPGIAHLEEHPYQLYVSEDNGAHFTLRSMLSFSSTMHCYYGTMAFLANGQLIVYIYDGKDEHNLKYIISEDNGKTWLPSRRAFFLNKMRNPQLAQFKGEYFIHGRSGSYGKNNGHFILYHSKNGITWDDGVFLCLKTAGVGAYSNNIVVGEHFHQNRQKLLIQTSHAYKDSLTNTIMWWLEPI